MQLARFLNKLFKKDGFILVDADSRKHIIGLPEKKNLLQLGF
jgi:cyclopropane-fatty-acyl-phospholipid synthase